MQIIKQTVVFIVLVVLVILCVPVTQAATSKVTSSADAELRERLLAKISDLMTLILLLEARNAELEKQKPVADKVLSYRWSSDLSHKYYQQVFWEMRGDSYSWKWDKNGGRYTGVCSDSPVASYLDMMKRDGLTRISCSESPNWFYVEALLPNNGGTFCLNRRDGDGNDDDEAARDCTEARKATFTNVVRQ
jgi:hypothetical protein